ncbi:MAG: hypothetical protein ACRDSK_32095, partial [Actinophytocola sp.]
EHERAEAALREAGEATRTLANTSAERDAARAALEEERAKVADHTAHLAKTAAALTTATQRADTHERHLAALRETVLDDTAEDLRTRLLAVLLAKV